MNARGALLSAIAAIGGGASAAASGGCGEPAARVTLVNVGGGCGRPAGATEIRIIAYARGGEVVRTVDPEGDTVDLADFPGDTEQLGVEVVVANGVVAAAGKTAPFDFLGLPDGAQLPVFVAPVEDFCPAADLGAARAAPLVARTSTGVLVAGGIGAGGAPLGTAERYDPATNAFVTVAVPAVLAQTGFVGAQLTAMPDGRVVVSGGRQAVIAVYDPATDSFGEAKLIVEGRAFHGAIAIDETHVLTAGGCAEVASGACSGGVRRDSHAYDVDEPGVDNMPGAELAAGRIGAALFDLGLQRDGRRAYVAAGGEAPAGAADPTAADRFTLDEPAGVAIGATFAQPVLLDGGGVLTAFAPDNATTASGAASVIAPGAGAAYQVATAPALGGVRLVALEDGRVLGFGGDQPSVLRYDPMRDDWQTLALEVTPARPGALVAPRLIRLADGAVLVLGGTVGGQPTAKTWIYRPTLLGPATGSVTIVPSGDARTNALTPVDPATVARAPDWTLTAPPGELARALAGGPRMATGAVRAVVRVRAGGVALIARQEAPGQAIAGELLPGAPARIVRLDGAETRVACTGTEVAAFDPATGAIVALAIDGGRATLSRDGETLATCDVQGDSRGAWGVAALGGPAGGQIAVDTVTVARAPTVR